MQGQLLKNEVILDIAKKHNKCCTSDWPGYPTRYFIKC